MPRKIAFIKSGTFSHTNESVRKQLVRTFPDFEVVCFDVRDLVKGPPAFVLRNAFSMLATYGVRDLIRIADPIDCYIQTPACFTFLRKRLRQVIDPAEFAFTFQTQTLWDASIPDLHHFIYTDQTNLTHLKNPGIGRELRMLGAWWDRLETEILSAATRVFTMSSHVTASMIDDYKCDPAKVECVLVGNNAPVAKHISTDLERYAKKRILFVGVNWDRKGGPQLLAAFRQVRDRHPEATLTIVGCSPDLNEPGCEVIGRIDPAGVSDCYRNASLFCLPTKLEAFGIVFIEAMQHGLPVVGTDMGAMPDFIRNGENGHRVKLGDVDTLAAILNRLLHDPAELRRLGENSIPIAAEYTWDRVGDRFSAAIRECISPEFKDKALRYSLS